MRIRNGSIFTLLVTFTSFLIPQFVSAQIIGFPDCNLPENHDNPFCSGQCQFIQPLPAWCPQPEPTREPVVLVPGLLASYNKKLLLEDKPGGTWRFVPFGNIYKGLIQKLEKAGYVEGHDLFIAYYDWRQPNQDSAYSYLEPAIDQAKLATGSRKVNIIAHSMGGLVARSYIEGNRYVDDVDKLILLGTPNQGAADAYVAWEGGFFPKEWGALVRGYVSYVDKALRKTRQQNLNPPESFRTFFPSLKELLPIFDFAKKNNQTLPNNQLTEQNTFLQQLQTNQHLLADRGVTVTTIAGNDEDTLNSIAVDGQRTTEDTTLERWRDGHPQPDPPATDSQAGDQTVLLTSALFGSDQHTLANTTHTKLPEAAQDQVLETLGVSEPSPHTFFSFPEFKKILSFVVMSPLDITITAPDGKVISKSQNDFGTEAAEYDDDPNDPDDPKIVTLADPPVGEYEVKTVGTGSGDYTVITTYVDDQSVRSTTRTGTTQPGQTETSSLLLTPNSVQLSATDIRALVHRIQQQIKDLPLQRQISKLIAEVLLIILNRADQNLSKYQSFCDKKSCDSKQAQHFYAKAKDDLKLFEAAVDKIQNLPTTSAEIRSMIFSWESDLTDAGF